MPKLAVPLTDLQVRRAKAGTKLAKLPDGEGMHLEIHPNGNKFWRFRYRQGNGKENVISFGKYPEISLGDARERRAQARRVFAKGGELSAVPLSITRSPAHVALRPGVVLRLARPESR